MVICSINSVLINFDKEAEDDVVYRQQVIDDMYGSRDIIDGNDIRDLLYRYTTNTTVDVVDSEILKLRDEGLFSDDAFISFHTILYLDFYFNNSKVSKGLEKAAAAGVLNRTVIENVYNTNIADFKQIMMKEFTDLIKQNKIPEPTNPESDDNLEKDEQETEEGNSLDQEGPNINGKTDDL